jgi:hypothetical protein
MSLIGFIGIQSVVLLSLRGLVIMCIVFRMWFITMLSPSVPVHGYFILLTPFTPFFLFLLLLFTILQDIRCIWEMIPYPSHLKVAPRYSPCAWFIPFYKVMQIVENG